MRQLAAAELKQALSKAAAEHAAALAELEARLAGAWKENETALDALRAEHEAYLVQFKAQFEADIVAGLAAKCVHSLARSLAMTSTVIPLIVLCRLTHAFLLHLFQNHSLLYLFVAN